MQIASLSEIAELGDRLRPLWTSDLDPLFWPASRSGVESAWVAHIPFAHWLVAAHRPRSIVELGTHNGVSYSAFCEAVQRCKLDCRCLAVDTWQGDEHAGFYGGHVLADLRRFHDGRYAGFSELLRATFDDALNYVPDGSVDLLHIDGLHTYDAVRHDFEAWRPKLTDRAVVLFHDTNVRERGFGVWRLFRDLSRDRPAFEFLHGHGLGVLVVGTSCGETILDLTTLSELATNAVRERFSFLGDRWQAKMDADLARVEQDRELHRVDGLRHEQAVRANALEIALAGSQAELQRAGQAEARHAAYASATGLAAAAASERALLSEQSRVVAEQARLQAEQERVWAEQERAGAEQERARAVQLCEDAELARQVANTARETAEQASTELARGWSDTAVVARHHEAECKLAWRDVEIMAGRVADLEAALRTVQQSTTWRMTWPVRRLVASLPRPARRGLRKAGYFAWWAATLQLPGKLDERRGRLLQTPVMLSEAPSLTVLPDPVDDTPGPEQPTSQVEVPGLIEVDVAATPAGALADPALALRPPGLLASEVGPRHEAVDIIVCVHDALDSVRVCIESLLRCTLPPYRVIIVDDGSSLETAAYLDDQVQQQDFAILRHSAAQGYTRAANDGLRMATAPWIVLLNSDTIVTPGWVDRMWAHGARDASVGVIGPVSNTASWQSVPRLFRGADWAENALPRGVSVEDAGAIIASVAIGAVPLPFLNGFCYMIRAELLNSVGLFDEVTFGAGYGEENDFSIRARNAGWSLVVATDVYVHHVQSMSYSHDRRLALVKQADELLAQKHYAERDIWPQAAACHNSLAMASVRGRFQATIQGRGLLAQARDRFEGKRIVFVLPISERGGGGNVIYQESLALQRMGVDVTLLNLDDYQRAMGAAPELQSLQMQTFANSEALTTHLLQEQHRYDAIVATLYRTVYWLPLQVSCRLGYYVQDFEPLFFPQDHAEYKIALQSYSYSDRIRLVTKTRWNQMEVALRTGRHAALLGVSVETALFAPGAARSPGAPIRIAAMVRPSTPRRAPARTMAVLKGVMDALQVGVTVSVFGCGDEELAASGLHLTGAVNYGHLDRRSLAGLLAQSDIFVDCSDYQAMGLTALEAMLCGCAVIAPQHGGANDFVRTGVNGVLVDTADAEACVAAVLRLVRDPTMLAAIRLRAVEDANQYIPEAAALRLLTALFDA